MGDLGELLTQLLSETGNNRLQDDKIDHITSGRYRRMVQQVRNAKQIAGQPATPLEDNELRWQIALTALAATRWERVDAAADDERSTPESTSALHELLWRPMREQSVVLRAWEADRKRDEDAVVELARCLSRERFPDCRFVRIDLGKAGKGSPGLEAIKGLDRAVCIVGRQGLYGKGAAEQFVDDDSIFYFPLQQRPRGLSHAKTDPDYHRIVWRKTRSLKKNVEVEFLTEDSEDWRKDYAVVQRIYINDLDVIVCAGCTSYGTLAAVFWATEILSEPGWPLPSGVEVEEDAHFEALLEVSGPSAKYPEPWEIHNRPQVVEMFLNGWWWDADTTDWARRPEFVRVDSSGGKIEKVEVEGAQSTHKPTSVEAQLLAAICEQCGGGKSATKRKIQSHFEKKHGKGRLRPAQWNRVQKELGLSFIEVENDEFTLTCEVITNGSKPRKKKTAR